MTHAMTPDNEVTFLETAADNSLFHHINALMTAELCESGHDVPAGSLTAGDLHDACAIFACRELSILGMIVVRCHAEAAELYRLWVVPSERRSGVGRALMKRAESFVAVRGGQTIAFDTGQDLTRAVALYRSLHYKEEPFSERSPRSLRFHKSLEAT